MHELLGAFMLKNFPVKVAQVVNVGKEGWVGGPGFVWEVALWCALSEALWREGLIHGGEQALCHSEGQLNGSKLTMDLWDCSIRWQSCWCGSEPITSLMQVLPSPILSSSSDPATTAPTIEINTTKHFPNWYIRQYNNEWRTLHTSY